MMRWNLILAALLAAVHLVPLSPPGEEVLAEPLSATPFELHVLASRAELAPERMGAELLEVLESAPSPLREMPYTNSLCKLGFPRRQLEELRERARGPLTAQLWLHFFLQFRKPGGFTVGAGDAMTRRELAWTLGAMDGIAPPEEAREAMAPVLEQVGRYLDSTRGGGSTPSRRRR